MSRPFNLYKYPPITLEVKYGERTSRAAKRLQYFKIVTRERHREGGVDNYAVCQEPIDKLIEMGVDGITVDENGNKWPTVIPIRLISDSMQESFNLFRGFYNRSGVLGCGQQYGEEKALRRWYHFPDFGVDANAPDRVKEEVMANHKLPYEVDCTENCPYWNTSGQTKCDIAGTLYFHLDESLPFCNRLAALRVKGTFAKRILESSLSLLHKKSGGILANIPLNLRIHYELKRAQDGKHYSVPMITLEHRGSIDNFLDEVAQEVDRRKRRFTTINMREPENLSELLIEGVLSEINSRDAIIHSVEEVDFEMLNEGDDSNAISEEVRSIAGDDFSDQLIRMAVQKFTEEGELNIDKLKEFFEEKRKERGEQLFEF